MGLVIGYDGKRAVQNMTGLGNYSRLLVDSLAKEHPDDEFRLYAPKWRDNPRLTPVLERPNVKLELPRATVIGSLWRSRGVVKDLRRDHVDLFHGLSGELPVGLRKAGIPSVVTIHDVIFRRFPEYYKPIDRWIYDRKFARACREATRVIAISERTAHDIMELYGTSREKIDIVYQGCDPQFARPISTEEVAYMRRRYGLDFSYIVSIGTVEDRKNQLLAVKALAQLPKEIRLVIVGGQKAYAQQIKAYVATHGLEGRVVWIDRAPFPDLPLLYRGAILSVYPSRYEGFGLPVIESLSTGTPVVVARGSCLEEAGGPDTPAVDPDDVDELATACLRLIDDPVYHKLVAERGREYVRRFDLLEFAPQVWNVYLKALK
ncbi:MAG: glycosyltransferase family 4 protein [Bacteroidales bacterium]|nr:glycosyltransferase family 4 protein [Bacteroidales bacterium]